MGAQRQILIRCGSSGSESKHKPWVRPVQQEQPEPEASQAKAAAAAPGAVEHTRDTECTTGRISKDDPAYVKLCQETYWRAELPGFELEAEPLPKSEQTGGRSTSTRSTCARVRLEAWPLVGLLSARRA